MPGSWASSTSPRTRSPSGGAHDTTEAAVAHGLKLVEEGADLLDVGGESTRPGAAPVSIEDELRRVIPVIEQLAARTSVPISIDTFKPEVMRAAVAAGAGMINDIFGLRQDGALDAAAEAGVPVILMHMQGEPGHMQVDPYYDDVVAEVHGFLVQRLFAAGNGRHSCKKNLLVDLGFSFGKTTAHNADPARRAWSASWKWVCRCWPACRASAVSVN